MNKKLLCAALLAGLGVAQAASAQDSTRAYDDRWYVTSSVGYNFQDKHRGTNDAPFVTLGVGKFLTPLWSLDGEVNYQNPHFNGRNGIVNPDPQFQGRDLNWSQYGISLDVRRHFIREGHNFNPYLLAGLGYQQSTEQFDNYPNPNSPADHKHGNIAGKFGVGIQGSFGRVGVRAEVASRIDANNNTRAALRDDNSVPQDDGVDWFGDVLASVGVVIPLGAAPQAPVAPAPVAAPNCADMDDDGDGVNNCNDKCPGSQAGQTIGPDGCPVPVSIDLKGVNFDFDKSTLRPDAVAILNQAIDILKRYPDLKVEVAGHTDSIGTDAYNQKLSERRAKAVYDFLGSNGVDAGRLVGPHGYGESRPIAPNTNPDGSDNPEGRAQNRRTELNVQN